MADKKNDPMGWWSEHPSIDFAAAGIIVAIHLGVTERGHGDVLSWVDSVQRQTLYATGAGVVAVIGGLAAISLAMCTSPPTAIGPGRSVWGTGTSCARTGADCWS